MAHRRRVQVTIGERFRRARLHRGLHQYQLAKLSEVSKSTMSRLECDQVDGKVSQVLKIAAVLKCSTDTLLPRHLEEAKWDG
jgi:transcriptional regulator with XRE-family HTH domain